MSSSSIMLPSAKEPMAALKNGKGYHWSLVKNVMKVAINGTAKPKTEEEPNEDLEKGKDYMYYRPLIKAAMTGDWKKAESFFESDHDSKIASVFGQKTALHYATASGHTRFIEQLIQLMPRSALAKQDDDGDTALHYAAMVGNNDIIKALAAKNTDLTQMRNKLQDTPIRVAALCGHEKSFWSLLFLTRDEDPSPFRGLDGASLLNSLIAAGFYGAALHLVQQYPDPEIATGTDDKKNRPLCMLAQKSFKSISEGGLTLWQRGIYSLLPETLSGVFVNVLKQLVPSINHVYKIKSMHTQYQKLADYVCEKLYLADEWTMADTYFRACMKAAETGNTFLIGKIIEIEPEQVWQRDDKGHNILEIAVIHRQENVFNLLKGRDDYKLFTTIWGTDTKDTILHLAAKLAPSDKLNDVSGAALQMQRELQWFKGVADAFVKPSLRERKNSEGKSPRELFSEEHKELREKGEKWMKDMSSSSMLVATLIATVAFAAAFTVPGGNQSEKGIPIFLNKTPYMVFAVSNALAFFSSLTSVLMFVSILTARYAEEDFLKSLPQKLIIGLAMLFISTATMTMAFSATYFIMLTHRLTWISVLITLLTCFPVALFAWLQLPLFLETVHSTYGSTL